MTYSQSITYLNSLKSVGMQMGLERTLQATEALGHPEHAFPIVHVAGTNGKGSTARMIAAILTENGYKTGLYTSPPLEHMRETILIDGVMISEEEFGNCVSQVANAMPSGLSEYECLTCAMFVYFQTQQVDIAVIECCLGGETDTTNIIPAPLCAVFTPIDLDHTAILGNTVEAIAKQKSGIIKAGCDVVCAPNMNPLALGEIFEKAFETGSTVHQAVVNENVAMNSEGIQFTYDDHEVCLSMLGEHQHHNALTALTVCKQLQTRGFRSDASRTLHALSNVKLACRQEIVSNDPFILLDAAHNPHGIHALCETLKILQLPNATLLIGMLADKDVSACLKELAPFFQKIVCCTPPNTPRAMKAASLADIAAQFHDNVEVADDPVAALENIKKAGNGPIVVGGSFYTAAAVRRAII